MRICIAITVVFIAGLSIAGAQNPPPETLVEFHTMQLDEGTLSGSGAEIILSKLPNAQFILIGESHGFADPPNIALALARASQKFGVRNHVVEEGPLIEEWVEERLKSGGIAGLREAFAERPTAVSFLSRREDAELAAYFIDAAPPETDVVWGVDQEFIGSTLVHFETLQSLAPTKAARALVTALLAAERDAYSRARFDQFFLSTAASKRFDELRAEFAGITAAVEIIDGLERSAKIYNAYNTGLNYASNTDRITLIREQFLKAYRKADGAPPRVLIKYGAVHVGRGTTFVNTFDLGSLTEGIAAEHGLEALRIAVMPLAGTQLSLRPNESRLFQTIDYHSDEVAELLSVIGLDDTDIPELGYAVIPLEPVRRNLEARGLKNLSVKQRYYILGYDFLVTTKGAQASTLLSNTKRN